MKHSIRISACVLAALTLSGCQGILNAFNLGEPKQYRAEAAAQVFGQEEVERGRAALKAGYPAEAIKQFRLATLNQKAAPDAYNGLGIAYARIGRADLAERYFKMAVTLDSSNPRFAANLDNFYKSPLGTSARALAMRQKEVDEALAAAAYAAQAEGLLEPLAEPEQRGAVAIEQKSRTNPTRTSPHELLIVARSGDNLDRSSNALASVAVRHPTKKEAADAIDSSSGQPTAAAVQMRPVPARVSLLRPAGERNGYPIRITLTRPTDSGKSRPTPARSAYPLRIALSPSP